MGIFVTDGPWQYHSGTGSTFSLDATQRLLALRVFAATVDGSFTITGSTFSGDTVTIRTGTGFDWTPAGKVVNANFTFSSAVDWFAEYSS